MPALTIPACGFTVGSRPQIDAGITRKISYGGAQVGFSDYDAVRRVHTLVFSTVTLAEWNTMYTEWDANKLTGGMTFTLPWQTGTITAAYADEPDMQPGEGLWLRVTLVMQEQ